MLELTKTILQKVSFDRKLFKKELIKATRWLAKDELMALKTWGIIAFAGLYDDLILEIL